MKIPKIKTKAMESMSELYLLAKTFSSLDDYYIFEKRLNKLHDLIELLPTEPKPEPSKSLDEVVQEINNLYQNSRFAPIPVLKIKEEHNIAAVKRILIKSGLVMPVNVTKCECGEELKDGLTWVKGYMKYKICTDCKKRYNEPKIVTPEESA